MARYHELKEAANQAASFFSPKTNQEQSISKPLPYIGTAIFYKTYNVRVTF